MMEMIITSVDCPQISPCTPQAHVNALCLSKHISGREYSENYIWKHQADPPKSSELLPKSLITPRKISEWLLLPRSARPEEWQEKLQVRNSNASALHSLSTGTKHSTHRLTQRHPATCPNIRGHHQSEYPAAQERRKSLIKHT